MSHPDKDRTRARAMRSGRKHEQRLEHERLKKRKRAHLSDEGQRRGGKRKGRRRAPAVVDDDVAMANGVVVAVAPGRAWLWRDGGVVEALLSPALARAQQTEVAVGDDVHCAARADQLVVERVEPRRSALARPDPGNPRRQRVLVANVDVGVVVLSIRRPPLRAAVVDRFLVALEYGGVAPLLCINKMDLVADGDVAERDRVAAAVAPYRELGIPVLEISAETGLGVGALRASLAGRTAAFVGHSGVGKSALLNALDPATARDVGAGRAFDGKGRHTTRGARLVALADGTRLIDTAGVREFGLWGMTREQLRFFFPEFVERAAGCRFADCSHVHEPDCAVLAAVGAGAVSGTRHAAYLRLLAGLS